MTNDDFKKAFMFCDVIAGAFEPQSLALFLAISALCNDNGRAIEFGVLHGKSAAGIVYSFNDITLVDKNKPSNLNDLINFDLTKRINFHENWSNEFTEKLSVEDIYCFCHIDTSHYFSDTLDELNAMSDHMTENGVIVLDDWNEVYQQVRAGYFYAKYKNGLPWDCFLVAHNKAYLCRTEKLNYYLSKVSTIKKYLDLNGFKSQLVRTDDNPLFCPFYLRPLKDGDEEYYGTVTYGDRFFKILENYNLTL